MIRKMNTITVVRPDRETAEITDGLALDVILSSARTVSEGKADAAALAAALGVTEAEATRRALAMAVEMMGGGK